MAVDLVGYEAAMDSLANQTTKALGVLRYRLGLRDTMQGVGQPLTAQQQQSLLANQLARTQALQASLTAAIVAIDPNQ